jgi:hypothetical protein
MKDVTQVLNAIERGCPVCRAGQGRTTLPDTRARRQRGRRKLEKVRISDDVKRKKS